MTPGMKTTLVLIIVSILFTCGISRAQEQDYKKLSYGINLGDPLGATLKYKTSASTAFAFGFGPDYFGSPRLNIDYIRQFAAFRSSIVKAYMGPGLAIAFAKGATMFFSHEYAREWFDKIEDKGFELGGRAIFGLNITPVSSQFEFFLEAGPMVAFARYFDLDMDGAFGVRFYP